MIDGNTQIYGISRPIQFFGTVNYVKFIPARNSFNAQAIGQLILCFTA
jgi:hypothetical protein